MTFVCACAVQPEIMSRALPHDEPAADSDAGMTMAMSMPPPRNSLEGPSFEARFEDDPAPAQCGPDGIRREPTLHEDAPDCPMDKHAEGCPCDTPDETAHCWPGRRIHRNHGQCHDGVTTCEKRGRDWVWSACEDFVLPEPGASAGPEACRCFSNGQWTLSNLVPCIYEQSDDLLVTSSMQDGDGGYTCGSAADDTGTGWTSSTLTVECAGQYKLCFTIKAGNAEDPKPDDCILQRLCVDTWYPDPGMPQDLPELPSWRANEDECTRSFVEAGGYGEMSVVGISAECDAVDDGHGAPYVFKRTRYCSKRCALQPDRPECKACGTGVSGRF